MGEGIKNFYAKKSNFTNYGHQNRRRPKKTVQLKSDINFGIVYLSVPWYPCLLNSCKYYNICTQRLRTAVALLHSHRIGARRSYEVPARRFFVPIYLIYHLLLLHIIFNNLHITSAGKIAYTSNNLFLKVLYYNFVWLLFLPANKLILVYTQSLKFFILKCIR